jgi:hypothetical protein
MVPPFCTGGVLVRPNDGAVHEVQGPVQPPIHVRLPLQGGEDPIPDSSPLPTAEAAGDGPPGAVPRGQIAPRRAGAQDPEDAIDHRAVVVGGASSAGLLRREQRAKPFPLRISQDARLHPTKHRRQDVCGHALVIRPIAAAVGLLGSDTTRVQRTFISWFGVRGIGSIYYLMFALVHGLEGAIAREMIGLTLTVIATSVVIHGMSVTPMMSWYNHRYSPDERLADPTWWHVW